MRRLSIFLTLLLCSALGSTGLAQSAPEVKEDEPVYMQAEKMGYDQKNGIVLALGKVEVYQGESILMADRIAYYQTQNIVRADGNVSLLQPDGNVYFADKLTLKDDLKAGVIQNFRIRLSDNSLFAAREAQRVSPSRMKLRRAVYSPCKLCEGKDPLWQLKAKKVTIDEVEQRITYRDAHMEVYGVPVAYTPYFAHPTPDADPKSGLLIPEYEQSSNLGTMIKVPYYWRIGPDMDATLTPWYTTEEGPLLQGEYRQLTDNGKFDFTGSITNPRDRDASTGVVREGNDLRGHIFARGQSQYNETLSWGFDVNRTSDDTYLRRYEFSNVDSLTSRLYGQYLAGRNYALLESMAFQGLEVDDDPDRTPYVLPSFTGELQSRPLWGNSRVRFGTRSEVITRQIGADSRRVSVTSGWNVPYVSDTGHVFELDSELRTDHYSISDNILPNGQEYDGSETRFIPQMTLGWRYPMVKQFASSSLLVEPVAQFIASSNGNNPDEIPNEDSIGPEFSDINLFLTNRFAGADRIENGSRVIYGVRSQYQHSSETLFTGMLGENISLTGDRVYPLTNDLSRDVSDIVGQAGMETGNLSLDYRFRLDPEDGSMRRNEFNGSVAEGNNGLYLDYVDINNDPFVEDQRNVILATSVALAPEWTLTAGGQRDLENNQAITAGVGLIYQNECITVFTDAKKEYTRDRDLEPNTSVSVRLALKNLN